MVYGADWNDEGGESVGCGLTGRGFTWSYLEVGIKKKKRKKKMVKNF